MERAKRPYEGTNAYNAGVRDAEKRLRETSEWVWNENAIDWGLGAWVCRICGCRNDNIPHQDNIHLEFENPYIVLYILLSFITPPP